MKILQINIFYNEGSTGKIVDDIHKRLLRDGHESYVVFGRGKNWQEEDCKHFYRTTPGNRSELYRKISRLTGLRYNTAYFETYKLLKHIDKIKPDIVHLHGLNCAYINPYILLKHLGRQKYPVLVTHHADVTITANCDHAYECEKWKTGCGHCASNKSEKRSFFIDATHYSWIQMKNAFKYVEKLYASGVSEWMSNRVRQSPFFDGKVCQTILNGLDIDSFKFDSNYVNIRKKLGLEENDKVVIHVTPNFLAPIKGGRFVIEMAQKMPNVKFVVIGVKQSQSNGLPKNVIPILHTSSKSELAQYYSMADVTLLTSYRESFSMVTAESLCCGTPVVGFKAGAPETITIPEYSEFVEYGNLSTLETALRRFMNEDFDKQKISTVARGKYDAERMYEKYAEYYNMIYNANSISN